VSEGATKRARRLVPIAVALGVVAAIFGGRALLDSGTDAGTSSRAAGDATSNSTPDPLVAPETASAGTPPAPQPDAAAVATTPARTPDAPPVAPAEVAAPGPMVEPHEGTIVVIDRDGVEHAEESGSFMFERFDPTFEQSLVDGGGDGDGDGDEPDAAAPDPARAPVRVEVVRGRFVLDAAHFRKIRLDAIELGGRPAVDGDEVKVARSKPISVRALWVEPVLLHVRDAATKAELANVTVVVQSEWSLVRLDHPGGEHPDDVVGRGLRSPVKLSPPLVGERRRLIAHYWVGAPGHAWGSASLQFDAGGEETVELEPAAALTVVVGSELLARARAQEDDPQEKFFHRQRPPPAPQAFLRLRRRLPDAEDVAKEMEALRELSADSPGGVVAEVAARDGDVRFEGLAPGERLATLEVGGRTGPSLLIAFAEVSLHAGEAPTVTLTRTEPRRVALAGTLFVPPSWDAATIELLLQPSDRRANFAAGPQQALPLSSMAAVAARPGLYRWRFEGITPSTYHLSVGDELCSQWIEVGSGGRDDVELVLPEIADVTAHVVDAESGAPVEVFDLLWFSSPESGRQFGGRFLPLKTRGAGAPALRTASTFTCRCPVGVGRFTVQSAEWQNDDRQPDVELHVGEQQVDVQVRRMIGVVVVFRVDGRTVPWPADSDRPRVSVAPIGEVAQPRSLALIAYDDDARFIVPAPGWYRITVPKLEGFAPVAPIDVDVDSSGFVTRVVDLQRE